METRIINGEEWEVVSKSEYEKDKDNYDYTTINELANPDLFKMMEYCREKEVVPNITINGERMTPELYDLLVKYCGAVAVSLYNKDTCYNAVKELTDRGMNQVNIHSMLSKETYDTCYSSLVDIQNDTRLKKLNAIVFLSLKKEGRGINHNSVSKFQFKKLVDYAIDNKVPFGFDSCTAPNFLEAVKDSPNYVKYEEVSEPCESSLFSLYINTQGKAFPCSFNESKFEGIDVVTCKDFMKDIWWNTKMSEFRDTLVKTKIDGCRHCPAYNLSLE
jgi:radical SAM protein with 4Fe4S-binding SPASM domain